ncbi:MAG: PhnD/SsuA/transferrin family substrate-binding protein [Planctomycetes bacterium]|nr:PhnD/SsuA/transferrin family substrate-binding protein [Planctomycetota bacterium]
MRKHAEKLEDPSPGSDSAEGRSQSGLRRLVEGTLGRLVASPAALPEEALAGRLDLRREVGEALDALLELSPFPPLEVVGDYRLLREVGRGSYGIVYEAWQVSLGRRVALKVLPASLLADPKVVARFEREGRVASRLDHPGICTVLQAGVEKGIPYIAMRFIDGETLGKKIFWAKATESSLAAVLCGQPTRPRSLETPGPEEKEEKPLRVPWTRAEVLTVVRLVERVARALHAAHEAGCVHRDVKPGNIMITPEGDPVILDFGLARLQDGDSTTLTQTGELMGTLGYMSPEQLSDKPIPIDRRTDVYSLGATLYECLTLRLPFLGVTREGTIRRIRYSDPPNPRHLNPRISRDLKAVLETALEKDPERRYRTALELAEDLRRIQDCEPIQARGTPPLVRARRWTQRNPALASGILGLIVCLAVALGFLWTVKLERDRTEAALHNLSSVIDFLLREDPDHIAVAHETRKLLEEGVLPAQDPELRLHFGVYTSDAAPTMYRAFRGAVGQLEMALSARLGKRVAIDFHIFRSYKGAWQSLAEGGLDLSRLGSASYVLARQMEPRIQLLVRELVSEKPRLTGVLIARKGSGIGSVEDLLKDNRVRIAFGSEDSTLGRYVAQAHLVKKGIRASDLAGHEYHRSHESVALAVLSGRFEVGAVKISTFQKFKDQAPGLESFADFTVEEATKAWVAPATLDPQVAAALREALLELREPGVLAPIKDATREDVTGFAGADDAMYDELRKVMRQAERFHGAGGSELKRAAGP